LTVRNAVRASVRMRGSPRWRLHSSSTSSMPGVWSGVASPRCREDGSRPGIAPGGPTNLAPRRSRTSPPRCLAEVLLKREPVPPSCFT
jgi:hypothetical protein